MADLDAKKPEPAEDVDINEVAARIEKTQRKLAADILDLRHETKPSVVASKTVRSLRRTVSDLIRNEEGSIKPEVLIGSAVLAAGIVAGVVVKIVKIATKD